MSNDPLMMQKYNCSYTALFSYSSANNWSFSLNIHWSHTFECNVSVCLVSMLIKIFQLCQLVKPDDQFKGLNLGQEHVTLLGEMYSKKTVEMCFFFNLLWAVCDLWVSSTGYAVNWLQAFVVTCRKREISSKVGSKESHCLGSNCRKMHLIKI